MASIFEMSVDKKGTTRYRQDKKFVGKDKVPSATLEALTADNIVDENGLVIVENKGVDDSTDTEGDSETLNSTPANDGDGSDDGSDGDDDPEADLQDNGTTPETDETTPEPQTGNDTAEGELSAQPDKAEKSVRKQTRVRPYVSNVPQSTPGMGFPRKNGKTVDIFDGTTPHTHIRQMGTYLVPLSAKNFAEKSDEEIRARLEELNYDVVTINRYQDDVDNNPSDSVLDGDDDGLSDDDV